MLITEGKVLFPKSRILAFTLNWQNFVKSLISQLRRYVKEWWKHNKCSLRTDSAYCFPLSRYNSWSFYRAHAGYICHRYIDLGYSGIGTPCYNNALKYIVPLNLISFYLWYVLAWQICPRQENLTTCINFGTLEDVDVCLHLSEWTVVSKTNNPCKRPLQFQQSSISSREDVRSHLSFDAKFQLVSSILLTNRCTKFRIANE